MSKAHILRGTGTILRSNIWGSLFCSVCPRRLSSTVVDTVQTKLGRWRIIIKSLWRQFEYVGLIVAKLYNTQFKIQFWQRIPLSCPPYQTLLTIDVWSRLMLKGEGEGYHMCCRVCCKAQFQPDWRGRVHTDIHTPCPLCGLVPSAVSVQLHLNKQQYFENSGKNISSHAKFNYFFGNVFAINTFHAEPVLHLQVTAA